MTMRTAQASSERFRPRSTLETTAQVTPPRSPSTVVSNRTIMEASTKSNHAKALKSTAATTATAARARRTSGESEALGVIEANRPPSVSMAASIEGHHVSQIQSVPATSLFPLSLGMEVVMSRPGVGMADHQATSETSGLSTPIGNNAACTIRGERFRLGIESGLPSISRPAGSVDHRRHAMISRMTNVDVNANSENIASDNGGRRSDMHADSISISNNLSSHSTQSPSTFGAERSPEEAGTQVHTQIQAHLHTQLQVEAQAQAQIRSQIHAQMQARAHASAHNIAAAQAPYLNSSRLPRQQISLCPQASYPSQLVAPQFMPLFEGPEYSYSSIPSASFVTSRGSLRSPQSFTSLESQLPSRPGHVLNHPQLSTSWIGPGESMPIISQIQPIQATTLHGYYSLSATQEQLTPPLHQQQRFQHPITQQGHVGVNQIDPQVAIANNIEHFQSATLAAHGQPSPSLVNLSVLGISDANIIAEARGIRDSDRLGTARTIANQFDDVESRSDASIPQQAAAHSGVTSEDSTNEEAKTALPLHSHAELNHKDQHATRKGAPACDNTDGHESSEPLGPGIDYSKNQSRSLLFVRNKRNHHLLPSSFQPCQKAVVIGKGRGIARMPGNVRLGKIVDSFLSVYQKCRNKTDRSTVVTEILHIVYKECPTGAFVRKEAGDKWFEVGDTVARIKIGSMLRDRLPGQYKSSTRVRVAVRRAAHGLQPTNQAKTKDGRNDDTDTDGNDPNSSQNMDTDTDADTSATDLGGTGQRRNTDGAAGTEGAKNME